MSRGIGRTQRLALLALWQARTEREEERDIGIPLTELKRRISSDRSNARRAIRNLMERGMVEEIREEGERRVKLTSGGCDALAFASVWGDITPDTIPSKPFDFDLIFREIEPDDLESPVSADGILHGAGETPWSRAADLETPVNDNTISRGLAWLEDQL